MLEDIVEKARQFISEVSKKYRIDEVYLFGSYTKGTWLKTSDIDLVIISRDFRDMSFLKRLDELNKIQWEMKITPYIEIIPLTPEELKERLKNSLVIRDASKYWIKIWEVKNSCE